MEVAPHNSQGKHPTKKPRNITMNPLFESSKNVECNEFSAYPARSTKASNEKLLVFSIEHPSPVKVDIQWPSGTVDTWDDLRVDTDTFNFVAVENHDIYTVP